MNCRDFETHVLDLIRDRLIDATTREHALGHAETCAQCAARLTEERNLLTGIRFVIEEMNERQAPVSVETSLIAAFRQQTLATAATAMTPIPVGRRHHIGWKTVAVAAGILLLISALSMFWLRSARRHNETAIAPSDPAKPFVVQTPPSNPGPSSVTQSQAPLASRRRVHPRIRTNSDEPEVMTRFFPLIGNAEDLSALENVRVVRVELPGSALSDVGIPVVPESRNTPVKADVVLGPDGSARAIRFVR